MSTSRGLKLSAPLLLLLCGAGDGGVAPNYTADGMLQLRGDYREWIYLSSGLDMSYSDAASKSGHSVFDNVFVNPAAWAAFKKTGHWPDKSVFVLEIRVAGAHASINKHGLSQTADLMGLEFHVRDESRFKGGWAFFESDGTQPARLLAQTESCYACHKANGAVDTTFVQFYPTAKPIAVKAGTYHEKPAGH